MFCSQQEKQSILLNNSRVRLCRVSELSFVYWSILQKDVDVSIANESNQVAKGHLVDALAHTGDEGRDTLR